MWGGRLPETRAHICLSVCLSICLSVCLPACLPIYLSIYLPTYQSSIYLLTWPSSPECLRSVTYQDTTRPAQDCSKTPRHHPTLPQEAPRPPQDTAPRRPQIAPRSPQDRPKSAPRPSQDAPRPIMPPGCHRRRHGEGYRRHQWHSNVMDDVEDQTIDIIDDI